MEIPGIIFWSSSLTLAFLYFGYYTLCKCVMKLKKFDVKKNYKFRPKVSFVIATWNEENIIEDKLKDTQTLKYPKDKLEIIVIDSGSTDKTRKIVKKFKKVKLITEKERTGKASALNKAFEYCNGDIIIISDADCRLEKNILEKAIPYFADASVGAVTGRQILINPGENLATNTEKTYRDFYYMLREAESKIDSTMIFHGEFSAFRKDLLDNIFEDSVADDSELALRVRKKNYKTLFVPEAIYKEYAPNKFSDRLKQKYRRAQGLVQIMFRFFKTFFLNPKYGKFGLLIFPMEFFMHVISPFFLIVMIVTLFMLPWRIILILIMVTLIALVIPKFRILIFSFLHSQLACLKGIISYLINGPSYNWEKIDGTRRY